LLRVWKAAEEVWNRFGTPALRASGRNGGHEKGPPFAPAARGPAWPTPYPALRILSVDPLANCETHSGEQSPWYF